MAALTQRGLGLVAKNDVPLICSGNSCSAKNSSTARRTPGKSLFV